MRSKASPDEMEFTATAPSSRSAMKLVTRKIWLPKLLYDSLPWFYMFAGAAALMATLYIGAWYWVVPHYLLFAGASIHLGITIYRRRRPRVSDTRQKSKGK